MSEIEKGMVERVGKAIWDARHAWLARSDPTERLSDACARAAIAAMREPTEAMTRAVLHTTADGYYCWQTMIDAALK